MTEFDPDAEVRRLRAYSAVLRKKSYPRSRSRLDRYRAELLQLKERGVKATELQRWLRERRIKVALSTVTRWLNKHG
ncbi:MAG: hypothetical protein U9Q71_02040 [Pseudomonadota bacterium]|nr:hypothetical protein [Pseudomonadota bacterium]